MAQNQNQGTDGQSIKPVSSLLSHFEALKTKAPVLKPNDRSPLPVRPSFDLPRPDSPWNTTSDPSRGLPQTPGARLQKDGESPTRSGHKRPMSMHFGSSPQLTPAVNIESPKSPPRSFFDRSISRSPERFDSAQVGKVKEFVSNQSSRSSTRPPSSGTDGDGPSLKIAKSHILPPADSSSGRRSVSPMRPPPPPINRADKPKIPAKPLKISQTAPLTIHSDLVPASATSTRVSPFNTPPSSDGLPSPEEPLPPSFPHEQQDMFKGQGGSHSRDPRLMGFSTSGIPMRANTVGERRTSKDTGSSKRHVSEQLHHTPTPPPPLPSHTRDPRMLGFDNSPPPEEKMVPQRKVAERTRPPAPPVPSVGQIRDARQAGFSSNTAREVQPTPHPVQPPRPLPPVSQPAQNRDPRQAGFGNPPIHEVQREQPPRRVVHVPPPRPSEESKNAISKRESPLPDVVERPRQRSVPQIPKSTITPSSDMRFPPPPKRSTLNGEQPVTPPNMSRNSSITPISHVNSDFEHDFNDTDRLQEPNTLRKDYPDATQTNRRPPFGLAETYEIKTKADGRVFDICGKYICVSGYVTRVFDITTGEQVLGLNHGETVKISSVRFKPGADSNKEGTKLWLGSNIGDLQEVDIETHSVVATSLSHNRRDVIKIMRHRQDLWTLDDDGKLFVWRADETREPNLKYSHIAHKTPRGHTFSIVIHDKLWLATGKEIRIYRPGNEATFTALTTPLIQHNVGDVTSGTFSDELGGRAYFGHIDGSVSIYSTLNYQFLGNVKASDYKINGLTFVGDRLWAAFKTGKVYVYDTSCEPWKVKKDWHAHAGPISTMVLDPRAFWTLNTLQVVTAGQDDVVRLWDATLQDDWMDAAMQEKDVDYCTFRELKAAVFTWNVGAVAPIQLRNDFVTEIINPENPPDILVFGFQEVVDLEDKAITAKSILGFAKKKDTAKTEQHQSRVYREWRDYLGRCIDRHTNAKYSYSELQTSSLIGLFQCVFIRQDERRNVSNLSTMSVKCGMGGHYGNKGALVTRFALDDSSLCFVNCHLAAGQSQTSHRNNDIATILESDSLPVEADFQLRSSLFVGGGDGSQILDHEICILNGDLNYRIDAIPRDTVVKMIKNNELLKLLERDQIMVSRRRVVGFRLAPFTEMPITFAPTYKYDVGTDNYDSSEKKRAPAWCDRLLFRGPGRIRQIDYRRHEVKVSDHRPVSGNFTIKIKKVDPGRQRQVREECFRRFQLAKKQMCETICVRWLIEVMGVTEAEARRLITG